MSKVNLVCLLSGIILVICGIGGGYINMQNENISYYQGVIHSLTGVVQASGMQTDWDYVCVEMPRSEGQIWHKCSYGRATCKYDSSFGKNNIISCDIEE